MVNQIKKGGRSIKKGGMATSNGKLSSVCINFDKDGVYKETIVEHKHDSEKEDDSEDEDEDKSMSITPDDSDNKVSSPLSAILSSSKNPSSLLSPKGQSLTVGQEVMNEQQKEVMNEQQKGGRKLTQKRNKKSKRSKKSKSRKNRKTKKTTRK